MCESGALAQGLIRFGFLDRVEVLALHVFDQGNLEHGAIAHFAEDGRNAIEPRQLGGSQPSLAGDQLIAVPDAADH